MVILQKNKLEFRFPEVHEEARCSIDFQRTLRIPDDNREHHLPPGLGKFPLLHVEDYAQKLPEGWADKGGAFLPMYQAEALWINFSSHDYPFAIKIAAGKINAVTGSSWTNELSMSPQNYVVLPRQPWLDGFCVQKGLIRQFVAMPLGTGYTAEEQLTGEAEFGGLQIIVYPMKAKEADKLLTAQRAYISENQVMFCRSPVAGMGLAPGGLMKQEIYEDEYEEDVWETGARSRCYVHLLNSEQYKTVTESSPPTKPPTATDYTNAGLPWFDFYDADSKPLPGSKQLSGLLSVGAKQVQQGEKIVSDTEIVDPQVIKLADSQSVVVDKDW